MKPNITYTEIFDCIVFIGNCNFAWRMKSKMQKDPEIKPEMYSFSAVERSGSKETVMLTLKQPYNIWNKFSNFIRPFQVQVIHLEEMITVKRYPEEWIRLKDENNEMDYFILKLDNIYEYIRVTEEQFRNCTT